MTKEELGIWGEEKATNYLLKKGFELVDRNIRFKRYEIDIVLKKRDLLVIVEVKTRNTGEIGEPWRAVTRGKQRQIIEVADNYVKANQIDKEVRFDVVSIVHNSFHTKIEHLEGAFAP